MPHLRLESNLSDSCSQELSGQETHIKLFSARTEKKRMKRNERALRTMWDTSNVSTYTKQEGQEKGDEGVEKISKEIMTEDFLNSLK